MWLQYKWFIVTKFSFTFWICPFYSHFFPIPENGNPLQYSGGVHRVTKSQTQLKWHTAQQVGNSSPFSLSLSFNISHFLFHSHLFYLITYSSVIILLSINTLKNSKKLVLIFLNVYFFIHNFIMRYYCVYMSHYKWFLIFLFDFSFPIDLWIHVIYNLLNR